MKRPLGGASSATAGRRAALTLLIASYALLAVAWVVGNPPGAAPDEGDHYLRALAVASGDLHGRPNPELVGQPEALPKEVGPEELSELWLKKGSRLVVVPGGLAPVEWGCNAFLPEKNASCLLGHTSPSEETQRLTTMGTVEPAMYLLPGAVARLPARPEDALRVGRAANAALNIALLVAAAVMLFGGGRTPLRLAGLIVAVTPMVIFVGSTIAPSGPEIAAAVCFFAAVVGIARLEGSRFSWGAAAVAGTILAVSRSLGPVWIVIMALVVIAWRGWRPCRRAVREGGLWAAAAALAIAVASASTVVWEATVQPGVDFDGAYFVKQIRPSVADLPGIGRDLVGTFGWLDTRMPNLAYGTWALMLLALVGLALLRASGRERLVLLAVPLGLAAVSVAISAGILRQNGFGLQGRHVLALAIMLPILAADVVADKAGSVRERPRPLLLGLAVPAMAVQAVGWYSNARRAAVGTDGPVWFLGHSRWSPPGTWILLGAVVALATVAGVAAAWMASREWPEGGAYAPGAS